MYVYINPELFYYFFPLKFVGMCGRLIFIQVGGGAILWTPGGQGLQLKMHLLAAAPTN